MQHIATGKMQIRRKPCTNLDDSNLFFQDVQKWDSANRSDFELHLSPRHNYKLGITRDTMPKNTALTIHDLMNPTDFRYLS